MQLVEAVQILDILPGNLPQFVFPRPQFALFLLQHRGRLPAELLRHHRAVLFGQTYHAQIQRILVGIAHERRRIHHLRQHIVFRYRLHPREGRMLRVEEQKPVARLAKEGIIFQMDESRVHDVRPFLLQLAEFHHLFAQVAVGEQFFLPFGVHFVAQLLGREVLEVYFLAQFGSELDHLRNDLVPEPARDLFRLSGEDKTHDNRLNFFREARQRLRQGLQPVFDLRIERRAFPIKIKC